MTARMPRGGRAAGVLALGVLLAVPAAHAAERVLTTAAQILGLTTPEAAAALSIRLQGVVVGEVPIEGKAFVLWDGKDCIYVRGTDPLIPALHRGDLVEVTGHSETGGFAPDVVMDGIRRTGQGAPPAALPVTYEQMVSGRLDSQWVRVHGIVRQGERIVGDTGIWKLKLATGGHILTVHVNTNIDPADYVDAEVAVEGFSLSQHNVNRQYMKPLMFVPRGVGIAIETPAPEEPFATPVRRVASLLQFTRSDRQGHRAHVRGVVTHQQRGKFLWIRDGDRGLRAAAAQADAVQPGQLVDVLGFPTHGDYTASLDDAVFRIVPGPVAPPVPERLGDLHDAIKHDADLVVIEARIAERRLSPDKVTLVLDWTDGPVPTVLPRAAGGAAPADWLPDSVVRVVGICSVSKLNPGPPSGTWEPGAFELVLRSPGDLVVLQPPPWWTHERVIWTLGIATGVMLLALAVVMISARRRLQLHEVRRAKAEAEFLAILSERNRVAREIHDTLAQGLSAISVQLELAKGTANGVAAGHVESAHKLVRESLADARASIWNMRSQVLENRNLATALEEILHQLAAGTNVEAEFRVTGVQRRLPPVTENDVLRIGQEAITNAVNHAGARRIAVDLRFAEKQVNLVVTDDGDGFDSTRPPANGGHFGLVGIRERAAQMHGEITVDSRPGGGTRIALSAPTPD